MSYQTEEEQLAALKQFWKRYGVLILSIAVLVAAIFYGNKAWNNHKRVQAEKASSLYQRLVELNQTNSQTNKELSEKQLSSFQDTLEKLKKDYSGSIYTQFAYLLKARQQILANKPEEAKAALQAVLKTTSDKEIKILATLRLASILTGENKAGAQKSLDLLNKITKPGAFKVFHEEALGDAYAALEQTDKARIAYQNAAAIVKETKMYRPSIKLKLSNLTLSEDTIK